MTADGQSFKFSLDAAAEAEHDLDLQIEALETKIARITDKATIKGHPLITMILQLTQDKEELSILGEGLKRVAVYVTELTDLKQRKGMLEVARSNPDWLFLTFGDLSSEIDQFVATLEETDESGD